MSTKEMDKIAKKIKPIIERMSLELYKKQPKDVVNKSNIKFKQKIYRQNL